MAWTWSVASCSLCVALLVAAAAGIWLPDEARPHTQPDAPWVPHEEGIMLPRVSGVPHGDDEKAPPEESGVSRQNRVAQKESGVSHADRTGAQTGSRATTDGSGWGDGDDEDDVFPEFSDDVIWDREREEERQRHMVGDLAVTLSEPAEAGRRQQIYDAQGASQAPTDVTTPAVARVRGEEALADTELFFSQAIEMFWVGDDTARFGGSSDGDSDFTGNNAEQVGVADEPAVKTRRDGDFDYQNASQDALSPSPKTETTSQPSTGTSLGGFSEATALSIPPTTNQLPVGSGTFDAVDQNLAVTISQTLPTISNSRASFADHSIGADGSLTATPASTIAADGLTFSTAGDNGDASGSASEAPPECLRQCQELLTELTLHTEPQDFMVELGTNVSVTCQLRSPLDLAPDLTWIFLSEDDEVPCGLTPFEDGDMCPGFRGTVEMSTVNKTVTVSRVQIPETLPADNGLYTCSARALCCGGTSHAQTISRSVSARLRVYDRPRYAGQLVVTCAACVCLAAAVLAVACVQRRRRRRRKAAQGPLLNYHYQPVRMLRLPNAGSAADGGAVGDDDGDDDEFDDMESAPPEGDPGGTVRVNPLADTAPPPTPAVTSPSPVVTSPQRQSEQFDFPRPPSELLKRLSTNEGFE